MLAIKGGGCGEDNSAMVEGDGLTIKITVALWIALKQVKFCGIVEAENYLKIPQVNF